MYIPSTERVREGYVTGLRQAFVASAGEHRAEFDAWLEAHDKSTKRTAWHEGASSRQCHCHAYSEGECACGGYPSERNPYT
jgi:hypothetical protein